METRFPALLSLLVGEQPPINKPARSKESSYSLAVFLKANRDMMERGGPGSEIAAAKLEGARVATLAGGR